MRVDEEKQARNLLVESLSGASKLGAFELVVGMAALALPSVLVAVFTHWDARSLAVTAFLVLSSAGSLFLSMSLRERVSSALHTRRVWRIKYGFDAGKYLGLLSVPRRHGRLVVDLKFDAPWAPEQQGMVAAAVGEWAPGVSAQWKSDRDLRLESPELPGKASIQGKGRAVRYFTNHALHVCFMEIVEQVVPRLHAAVPLLHLDFDVSGTTASFKDLIS